MTNPEEQQSRHQLVKGYLEERTDSELNILGRFFPDLKTLCEVVKQERLDREEG